MAKTEFLQIRMTPDSFQRLSRVAEADHLDESTWARRAILQALDRWEAEEQDARPSAAGAASETRRVRKVAEGKPPAPPRSTGKPARPAKSKSPKRKKPRD
jgi:predicted transcriptional regulator